MNRYTLLVKRQRKLLGKMHTIFKYKSKALYEGRTEEDLIYLDEQRAAAQAEYDTVTDHLAKESAIMIAKGLNPYDYAPEVEYAPEEE